MPGTFVSLFTFALALTFGACASAPPQHAARFELIVLGIAQDGGLPHYGCRRECCVDARRTGRVLDPACVAVVDHDSGRALLIEATPSIERQVARLDADTGATVAAVAITHAHVGHYLGLAQFGREVAATDAIPVYGSARFLDFLRQHGPWRQLVELRQIALRRIDEGIPFEPLPGLRVTAMTVPHRDEYSDTLAFKIHGPNRTVLFVPDVDRFDAAPGLLDRLLDGVDVAYLDATFYDGRELPGRDLREIPHPPMTDTMERLAQRARRAPGSLRFIHLNHTNPALHDAALRADVERRGFRIAEPGERIPL